MTVPGNEHFQAKWLRLAVENASEAKMRADSTAADTALRGALACPCCGQAVPVAAFTVSLDANTVTFGSRSLQVQPQWAEFLHVLLRHSPNLVASERLVAMIHGAAEPDGAANTLRVQMHRMRKALRPLGVSIENVRGCGYRLTIPKSAEAA